MFSLNKLGESLYYKEEGEKGRGEARIGIATKHHKFSLFGDSSDYFHLFLII